MLIRANCKYSPNQWVPFREPAGAQQHPVGKLVAVTLQIIRPTFGWIWWHGSRRCCRCGTVLFIGLVSAFVPTITSCANVNTLSIGASKFTDMT